MSSEDLNYNKNHGVQDQNDVTIQSEKMSEDQTASQKNNQRSSLK
jgi:hypothetical protein